MSKPKILMYAPREEGSEVLQKLAGIGCDIAFGEAAWQIPRSGHEDKVVAAAREAVALMGTSIRSTPISRRVMEASQRLRIIAKYTVGVDDIDVESATDLGILVTHAPTEANCFGVAEQTVAFMLALLKKIRERDADISVGKWRAPEHAAIYLGRRLSDGYPGITVGLVGLGRIGSRVADLLAPWRLRILAYDPYVEPARFLIHGVERVDYETLLRQSDVVSFHVVLNKGTRGMFSEREIALMKRTAVIVNTARGHVIDELALARALESGRIRAAAIDAFADEPLPMDSPLRRLGDKIWLSPHAASFNEGGELRPGIAWATRSVLAALAGDVPDNVYNKDAIPRWKERFGGASIAG